MKDLQGYYKKIADLLLFAVNFKAGDKLYISIDYDCREAARQLAAGAYSRGAAFVDVAYTDSFLHAEAIRAGKTSVEFPEYLKMTMTETSSPGWKYIGIFSGIEPDIYEDLPQDTAAEYFKGYGAIRALKLKPIMNGAIPWCLTYLPSKDMAAKSYPGLTADEALTNYWSHVISIMHLDEAAPVDFWKNKMGKAAERSSFMTNLGAEYLHFEGPGTDLKVGLNKNAEWAGGFKKSGTGESYLSNIPTDEIFTSPDWRTAEGRVSLTRPFVMHQNLGPIPVNAWFEFREGRVTDYGAESGRESLDALFARDERAHYLGEVALVDPRSPFAEAGIIFYNGLYDENAACHLALGKAYPSTLKTHGDYTDEQLLQMGMNTSSIHEDMMVGGMDVNVTAVLPDDSRVDIIKNGKMLI